jgi:Tol biopolymer transport system component/DNA-binding winged helix-turn-helix (wHTH) protein
MAGGDRIIPGLPMAVMPMRRGVRFGPFEVDFEACELRRHGIRIDLQEQPFRVLRALLEHPSQVVSRDELRRQLWPADTFVDFDRSLNTAVLKVRQALGDSSTHSRFLETIPRHGYRFIAIVEPIESAGFEAGGKVPGPHVPDRAESQAPVTRGSRRALVVAFASGVAVMTAATWLVIAVTGKTSPPSPSWTIKPLTSVSGVESAPSWSPDGRFVAFSRFVPDDANIFIMPIGGGDWVQLTHGPMDDMRPRWSPDGRYIAFLSDEGQTKRVYLIPPLGGARRMLADTGLPYLQRFSDSWMAFGTAPWSPDAQNLLFSRLHPDGRIGVWKTRPDTNQETRVTFPTADADDLLASWSFDGKWIAFTRRQSGRGGLWLTPAAGGEPRVLLRDEYDNTTPSFSSDSRRIVFQSNRGGPQNLWDVEIASGRLRQVTNGPGMDFNAVVGRDGGLLYTHHSIDSNLYRLDLSSSHEERLTRSTGRSFQPRLSPDGNRIAYYSDRLGNFDIFLFDALTKSERALTNHPAADVAPDWSPDGSQIVFVSNRDGFFRLWTVDVEQGTTWRILDQPFAAMDGITAGAAHGHAVRWSPDGRKIGFLAAGKRGRALWSVDADGRNSKELVPGALTFDWYRDSRHIVHSRIAADGSGLHEICLTDLENRKEVILFRGPHFELAAAKDGTGITYVAGASRYRLNLFLLRLDTPHSGDGLPRPLGEPKQLTVDQKTWYARNGGWSADGKTVVYVREQHEGDIYLIENYK